MTRKELTTKLLAAKMKKDLSFKAIATAVNRHQVWVTAAIYGQAAMDREEAEKLLQCLSLPLEQEWIGLLCEPPLRGSLEEGIPTDPLLYRFYEIMQVYGTTIKALISEEFGDGIMSAVDFTMDIERVMDSSGDRVKIVLDGKFLPYRKW